jgi:hypothetical protein
MEYARKLVIPHHLRVELFRRNLSDVGVLQNLDVHLMATYGYESVNNCFESTLRCSERQFHKGEMYPEWASENSYLSCIPRDADEDV